MGDWVKKSDNYGLSYKERVVGYIDVDPGSTYHDTSFAMASYWQDLALKPGRYEVTEHDWNGSNMIYASLPGKVTAAYFPSSYGGVPYGKTPQGENHSTIDSERVVRPSTYSFSVHKDIEELFGHSFTLTEMDLEQKHQRRIAERSLSSLMRAHAPDAKHTFIYTGETAEGLDFVDRIGDVVALVNQKRNQFFMFDEIKEAGLTESLNENSKNLYVTRNRDGSYEVKELHLLSVKKEDVKKIPEEEKSINDELSIISNTHSR